MIIQNNPQNNGDFSSQHQKTRLANNNNFFVAGTEKKTQKVNDIAKSNNSVQIRKLLQLDDGEKISEAVKSYTGMQSELTKGIMLEQKRIDQFKDFTDRIEYYSQLLENDDGLTDKVTVEDKRYDLEVYGNINEISRKSIENLLERAKLVLDDMVKPREGLLNTESAVNFSHHAANFETVTGITSEWLNMDSDDSLLTYKEGLTKENFLEKAEESIKKLTKRSEGLAEVMKEYMKSKENENLDDLVPPDIRSKMNAMEAIRQQFLANGKFDDVDRQFSLLNTLA